MCESSGSLEVCFRLTKQRITVVKFGMKSGGGDGTVLNQSKV